MELLQLRYFLVAAQYQHITKPPNICGLRSLPFPSLSTGWKLSLGFRFLRVRTGALN